MNTLIVVVKNPIPGQVKTRLQTRYTPAQAAALYRAFVQDTLALTQGLPIDRRIIAYDPPDAEEDIRVFCGDDWEYIPQVQNDLGQRMYQALHFALNDGAERAILLGTDIPSLPIQHLTQAFERLVHKDVVLGPSTDGGYYLVGLSKDCPEMFENITWSTPHVLEQTIQSLREQNYALGLIPPWFDIDTPEELDIVVNHARAQNYATPSPILAHTLACLSSLT